MTPELVRQFSERAARHPARIALITPGFRGVSYGELAARIVAAATDLQCAGVRPGDRVLFLVRPGPDAVTLLLALAGLGAVPVVADLGMGPQLFASRMQAARPRWVIADGAVYLLSRSRLLRRLLRSGATALAGLDAARATPLRVGAWFPGAPPSLRRVARRRSAAVDSRPTRADGMLTEAFIAFTSGTTDAPRAVVHGPRSIEASTWAIVRRLELSERDTVYSREMFLILPALLAGSTVVITRQARWHPSRTLAELERSGATHTFGVPADAVRLLEFCARRGRPLPSSLRFIALGAAPVHAALLERFTAIIPSTTQVCCVYGMTELLTVASTSLADKLAYAGDGDLLGAPFAGVETRVSDDGELIVGGLALFTGYLGHEPVREHPSGDLVRIDPDGRLVLLGRRKDMIIRGWHNIYPGLYEPTIARVHGVRDCAIVGVYREDAADEDVVLAVEAQPGTDPTDLRERVRRCLRSGPSAIDETAQPDQILVMRLPRCGRSSKIDRVRLREMLSGRETCASR